MEALQFGFNFATRVNNLNIVNSINFDYRYNDSNSNKGFIQELLTATTNVNEDNLALPWRHRAALRDLSRNNKTIITPDNGDSVVIMDSTDYDNKLIITLILKIPRY